MNLPVRVVLVETSHPGNIGAAARAMKTMGLSRLALVNPRHFPHAEASARASGATDVLAGAEIFATLAEAVADCGLVIGASARQRALPWPLVSPRECGQRVIDGAGRGEVALVFGREQSGLSNDELQRCNLLVQIPANPEYSSLNLAMAVQIIAYEIRVAAGGEDALPAGREAPLASAGELELFFDHLERALTQVGFLNPQNPRQLMLRLRRLFNRAELDDNEIAIMRGILSALAPGSGPAGAGREQD